MKVTIIIEESEFDILLKQKINEAFERVNVDKIIEEKVNKKVSDALGRHISLEKIDNMARDRVSRIITSESLRDFTFGIDTESITANLETKIMLMLQNSKLFKTLIKTTLKNSL